MELFSNNDITVVEPKQTFKNPYMIFIKDAKEIEENYIDADVEIGRNKNLSPQDKKEAIKKSIISDLKT